MGRISIAKGDKNIQFFKTLFTLKPKGRTRAKESMLLPCFKSKHMTYEKSVQFKGIREWNKLPSHITDLDCTKSIFKARLGKYLVQSRVNDVTNIFIPP